MIRHRELESDAAPDEVIAAIVNGDLRAGARLISRVENEDSSVTPILQALYARGGRARILGITGPPGAGKSTVVDQLLQHYRSQQQRVAVLAVDPSSPISGGAVLGDRVRMQRHGADPNVFIRSMATRGGLGGLSGVCADVLTILDAMPWDIVMIETVGVGQNEIEIMRHSSAVVLLQTPESGDAVQAVKAGILEIAHVLLVNKADLPGADRMIRSLGEMLANRAAFGHKDDWQPAIVKAEAHRGIGTLELAAEIDRRFLYLRSQPARSRAEKCAQLQARIADIAGERLRRRLMEGVKAGGVSQSDLEEVIDRRSDPYTVAERVLTRVNQ